MRAVTIDIVSDVICPWCYLGKRRLDRALAGLPELRVAIRWHPFLLDATIPAQGLDRQAYLAAKFGRAALATLHDPLIAAGKAEGIPYAFDRITRTPNTLDAHRLLRWAAAEGRQHALAERLFRLYWVEGQDVGDRGVLVRAAEAEAMDGAVVARLLAGGADRDAVIEEIRDAAELGITGVPTFVIGARYVVIGAQPPEVLNGAILRAELEARQPAAFE
jgi:predicted DsbA family dithiol-disulfide isomerase